MADKQWPSGKTLLRLNASQESARAQYADEKLTDLVDFNTKENEENFLQYENYAFRGSSTIG